VPTLNRHDEPRLERVFRLINTHFARDIPLAEAAKTAAMTPSAFCRYFRARTNRTYVTMLNEVRIGHACRALMASDTLIIDIAESCGFRNLANFNRQFKRITKHSPREYRKLYRG
jgi:transcriptional regulator GlxA family with amidase domain